MPFVSWHLESDGAVSIPSLRLVLPVCDVVALEQLHRYPGATSPKPFNAIMLKRKSEPEASLAKLP
jgi:hypothetical protein